MGTCGRAPPASRRAAPLLAVVEVVVHGGGVFDRVPGFAVLAGDPADGSGKVVASEHLNVRHLEGVDVQVVEPEQGDGIDDLTGETERMVAAEVRRQKEMELKTGISVKIEEEERKAGRSPGPSPLKAQ